MLQRDGSYQTVQSAGFDVRLYVRINLPLDDWIMQQASVGGRDLSEARHGSDDRHRNFIRAASQRASQREMSIPPTDKRSGDHFSLVGKVKCLGGNRISLEE